MKYDRNKDVYERKFLEILLRHELPDEATVRIMVTPRAEAPTGEIVFRLKGDGIDVDSQLEGLGLSRVIGSPTYW